MRIRSGPKFPTWEGRQRHVVGGSDGVGSLARGLAQNDLSCPKHTHKSVGDRWLFAILLCFSIALLGCEQEVPTPPPSPTPTVAVTPTREGHSLPDGPPQARLEAARTAAREGEWERAILFYESLREEPDYAPAALLELGDLFLADDQALAAAASWQVGLGYSDEGSSEEAAYRYRLGRGYAALEQHELAIEQWARVDELTDDGDGYLALRLANSYEALEEPALAAQALTRVYEHPGTERVTRALAGRRVGDYWAEEGDWERALLWYERTLELSRVEGFRAELIARLAAFALDLEDEGYAENQWHLLIDEYPATPEALDAVRQLEARGVATPLRRLALLYSENEAWDAAQATYELLQDRAPDDPAVLQEQAEMLARAGRWADAERVWQRLIDHDESGDPQRAQGWLGLARAQQQQGALAEAAESISTLLDEYPQSAAAPRALWEQAERLRGAEGPLLEQADAYDTLIERYPDADETLDALWHAGLLRYRAGQATLALERWRALAEAADDEGVQQRAEWWAGKAAAASGEPSTAETWWRRAAAHHPAGYYALRATAMLEERAWQPRRADAYRYPAPGNDDLAELAELLGHATSTLRRAEPESPLFAAGVQLLAWGERQQAISHFLEAIRDTEEPLELWAMASRLQALEVSPMSQAAAFRLMTVLSLDVTETPPALLTLAYPMPFEVQLRDAASSNEIDPLLLAALVHRESAWEPTASSSAAARGLTQVIPDTGAWIANRLGHNDYEFEQLDRPVVALQYGAHYLDFVLERFDDNPWHALAAYNAGPGNAQRWIVEDDDLYVELVPFAETRLYLESVYERWWAYDHLYREEDAP